MQFESKFRFIMHRQNGLPYDVNNHVHDCYEVIYYIKGDGVSTVNDTEFDFTDDCVCIIPPHTRHAEHAITDTELIYMGFEYDDSCGELPACLLKNPGRDILDTLMTVSEEIQNRPALHENILELLPAVCIIKLLRACLKSNNIAATKKNLLSGEESKLLDYSVNYILNNYSKEIDLQALAQSIGYSYHHFRHVFKEVYSFSPKQFIIKTRMNAAKNLLSTTDYKVETISELCGYRSVSQFIDTFSREVSVTPLKFRKEWGKYPESANFLK